MDPLLPLTPLASYIEHPILELPNLKVRLRDTGRLHPGSQNVLIGRKIISISNPFDRIEVAAHKRKRRSARRNMKNASVREQSMLCNVLLS